MSIIKKYLLIGIFFMGIVTVMIEAAPLIDAKEDTNNSLVGTSGTVIPNITENDTLDGNPVELGTDVNITNVTNSTVLEVDTVRGSVSIPAETPAGIYTETYTLCEVLNPTNCDDANITVTIYGLPDYRPKFTTHGLFVNGAEGDIDILLTIAEGLKGANTGDLRFTMRKNANLELNFDPNKTIQQGKIVQNAFWELSETSGLYIFKYVGNGGAFPPADISNLGFDAHFISPPSSKGKFDLRVQILDNSGGDTNKDNNKDTDTIRYNNL